jgi:hypothetical protein
MYATDPGGSPTSRGGGGRAPAPRRSGRSFGGGGHPGAGGGALRDWYPQPAQASIRSSTASTGGASRFDRVAHAIAETFHYQQAPTQVPTSQARSSTWHPVTVSDIKSFFTNQPGTPERRAKSASSLKGSTKKTTKGASESYLPPAQRGDNILLDWIRNDYTAKQPGKGPYKKWRRQQQAEQRRMALANAPDNTPKPHPLLDLFKSERPTVAQALEPGRKGPAPAVGTFVRGAPNQLEQAQRELAVDLEKSRTEKVDRMIDERKEREEALGIEQSVTETNKKKPFKNNVDVERMTWSEYNALTDRQRAAVDFNGMLVSAVRKDRRHFGEYDYTPGEKQEYDKLVADVFGKGHGSTAFAPETVAVLKQLDLNDDSADLDDFLTLKAAITAEDIPHLIEQSAPGAVGMSTADVPTVNRIELASELADKTQVLEEALAKGNQVLQSININAAIDRNEILGNIGGVENASRQTLGWKSPKWEMSPYEGEGMVPSDLNTYFQSQFDRVANTTFTGDRNDVLSSLREFLNEDEVREWLQYADIRSGNAAEYGGAVGPPKEGVKYRDAHDFRSLLGLRGGIGPDGRSRGNKTRGRPKKGASPDSSNTAPAAEGQNTGQ